MNRSNRWFALRFAATALVGFLVTPISSASTIATTQQEIVAMRTTASPPATSVPFVGSEPGADGERFQQIALMVSADGNDIKRTLLTRFPPTSVQSGRSDIAMGLQLPEPGPLSAIIATLALAGFVMVRRFV